MKPTIVTAFNDNPTYFSFAKACAKMWTNFGYDIILAYVSNDPDIELVRDLDAILEPFPNSKGVIVPLVEGIDSGVQSKITRMIIASQIEDFWIIDVDLFVLNLGFYEEKLNLLNGDNIICNEKHDSNPDSKWPMSSNIGSGELLKQVINPEGLDYISLIESWKDLDNMYDNMESVTNEFKNFSDESLIRRFVLDSGLRDKFIYYKRNEPNLFNHHINSVAYYHECMKRIDRAWAWTYNKQKLYDGYYIDCQPKRPLNTKDPIISDIFKYLKIEHD